MPNRRTFLSLMGLLAIAVVTDSAYSKGGHRIYWKQKQKSKQTSTCSEKHSEALKKCAKNKQSQDKCASDVEVLLKQCLNTGFWKGNKKILKLERR